MKVFNREGTRGTSNREVQRDASGEEIVLIREFTGREREEVTGVSFREELV